MNIRRGSRINTDRFPKREPEVQASWRGGGGVPGYAPLPKVPFLGFQCVIQTEYWPVPFSSDDALQIGGLLHQG